MTEMAADAKVTDDESGKTPSYLSTKPYKDVPINDQTKSLDASNKGKRKKSIIYVVAALIIITIIVLILVFTLGGKEEVEEMVNDVVEKVFS
mgnify:CR=1 FL=1